MEIVLIYSRKIESELVPASGRFDVLLELPFKVLKPGEVDVEELLLELHSRDYIEKVKEHPFFSAAIENLKCIVAAIETLEKHDVVIVPVTLAGHLAEKDRMRGSCLFNGLAVAAKILGSKGNTAVIETDAHHGIAAFISQTDAKFFCIGDRECEISDDLRCVLGRKVGKNYVESVRKMVDRVKSYNPEYVIWYLGADIDSREYAEMEIGHEEWDKIMDAISGTIRGRKTLILLASGSRKDVLRDVATRLVGALKGCSL